MSLRHLVALTILFLPLTPVLSASITLYDDSIAGGTPGVQDWLLAGADGAVTETAIAGGVNLITSTGVSGGYSNYIPFVNVFKNSLFPDLDRSLGFELDLELQLLSENHNNNNRAGFSIILMASDKVGIEIAFWEDRVWAQKLGFTHGKEALFDTTDGEHIYELAILGDDYALSVDGNLLLDGSLRDYDHPNPAYNLRSYLFLGDNTGSAGANIKLGQVTLTSNEPAAVPIAPTLPLLLFGVAVIFTLYRQTPDLTADLVRG